MIMRKQVWLPQLCEKITRRTPHQQCTHIYYVVCFVALLGTLVVECFPQHWNIELCDVKAVIFWLLFIFGPRENERRVESCALFGNYC